MPSRTILGVAVIALSACSGSSNSGMESERRREILNDLGVLFAILQRTDQISQDKLALPGDFFTSSEEATLPDNCESGDLSAVGGMGEREFKYIEAPRTDATFEERRYDECSFAGSQVNALDGSIESGTLIGSNPSDPNSTQYVYSVYGSNETASALTIQSFSAGQGDGESSTAALTGRIETAADDTTRKASGLVMSLSFTESAPSGYWQSVQLGSEEDPLFVQRQFGIPQFRINGPLSYATSRCQGGSLSVEMERDGFFDEEGYPTSASITVTGNQGVVEVEIDADGHATVRSDEFAAFRIESIELQQAIESPGC